MTDHVDSTRRDLLSLGALGAGAALGAAILGPATARADNGVGMKVGLVDIGLVFKNYERKATLETEINDRKLSYEKQAEDQRKVLEGLSAALRNLKEGSDTWRQKKKEINLQASQMKVIREGWEEDLKIQIENLTLMILNEIEDRVKKFGIDNKYDLIIKIDSQGWGDERFQERIFRAQVSSVLFYRDGLDVTKEVLKMLNDPAWLNQCKNKLFQNGQPNGQPAPEKPPK